MLPPYNEPALAVGTPSIVQQRKVLVVFAVLIGAIVAWQHTSGSFNHSVQKVSMSPVPKVVAALDFTSAEDSWSGLRIDSRGRLETDALTHAALADAIALMRGSDPELRMARMALLLEKQFGATTSQQVMALVTTLKNYDEMEQRWLQENGSRNPPAYEQLFQLQNEVLGEALAEKLFSEQRRLARMMLASQQIHNDSTLGQAEKDQALMDLQKAFQQGAVQDEAPRE